MNIDYESSEEAILSIRDQILQRQDGYELVIGVSRGGLIPGVRLSHVLGIPFRTIEWSTRDGQVKEINYSLLEAIKGRKILLVDDIIDSGITAADLLQNLSLHAEVDIACLVYNKAQNKVITPDYYHFVIDRSEYQDWINFWWEKK